MLNNHKKCQKNRPKKTNVFPLWALFVSLGCIFMIGLFLNRRLASVKKPQTFGFNFY